MKQKLLRTLGVFIFLVCFLSAYFYLVVRFGPQAEAQVITNGGAGGATGPTGAPGPASLTLQAGNGIAPIACPAGVCTIAVDNSVTGPPGPTGPQGATGPQGPAGGPTGPTGPQGPAGSNGIGFIAYFAGTGASTSSTVANNILNSFAIPAATLVQGVSIKTDLIFTHLTSGGGTCAACSSTPRIQLALCSTNIGAGGVALPSTTDDWAIWRPKVTMTGAAAESSIYFGWRANGTTIQTSTLITNSINPAAGCNLDVQGWFNANAAGDVLALASYEIWLVKNP